MELFKAIESNNCVLILSNMSWHLCLRILSIFREAGELLVPFPLSGITDELEREEFLGMLQSAYGVDFEPPVLLKRGRLVASRNGRSQSPHDYLQDAIQFLEGEEITFDDSLGIIGSRDLDNCIVTHLLIPSREI